MSGIINFYSENDFRISDEEIYQIWIKKVIESEAKKLEEVSFIFCNDDYLLDINQQYLKHDTYTDIISFDNTIGSKLAGDIFISTERVEENAAKFAVSFHEELRRVMAHGVLHFCGYKDKTKKECDEMRAKENEKIEMFHVEQ